MDKNPSHLTSHLDVAVEALRAYLLDHGNHFERGPAYEGYGKVLADVKQAVYLYEGLGYTKLLELGDPPFYALMQRGRREAHLLQLHNPQIQQWLADGLVQPNSPTTHTDQVQKIAPNAHKISINNHPRFHINRVDDVLIVTTDEEPKVQDRG